MCFLGYSPMHKGFKCLDILTGHVYVSSDVVFDKNVFPFSSLHPNAGARLRAKVNLLPITLLNPSTIHSGGEIYVDHMSNSYTNTTDDFGQDFGEISTGNGHEIMPREGGVSDIENEVASGAGAASGASASGSSPNYGQQSSIASSLSFVPELSSTRPTESAYRVVTSSPSQSHIATQGGDNTTGVGKISLRHVSKTWSATHCIQCMKIEMARGLLRL
jgi:hypothetical protein